MSTHLSQHRHTLRAAAYRGDVFAYSLPGGFARPTPWAAQVNDASGQAIIAAEHAGKRTLLVTDMACDLPSEWLASGGVVALPLKLRFDSRSRSDAGDVKAAIDFFRRDLASVGTTVQVLPLSSSGVAEFIYEQLDADTDFVLAIPSAAHRGNGYLNALTAAQNLMLQHGRARRQDGIARPFKMWVIDSTTASNGHAVLISESVRALAAGMTVPRLVQHIDLLRKHVQTLIVPRDVAFFRRHSQMHFEPAIGWLSYGVGRVLDRTPVIHAHAATMEVVAQSRDHQAAVAHALGVATRQVGTGLLAPFVCVSYAGDVAEVQRWPAFMALQDACRNHAATLHLGTMSMTNGVHLGAQALSISFA